ncbi:MAG: hypothetical protein V3U59_09240 [Gammaproteobacteria bacterium]
MTTEYDTRKPILLKLFGLALLIGTVLSAGAYLFTSDTIGVAVIERAVIGATRFNMQNMDLFDQPLAPNRREVQKALDDYSALTSGIDHRLGRFVAIRIYSNQGTEIARRADDQHEHAEAIEEILDETRGLSANPGDALHEVVKIEGVPYIGVYIPLVNSKNRVVAQTGAIFELSDESFAMLRKRVAKTIIAVFMIVLATTAVIAFVIVPPHDRSTAVDPS